MLLNVLCVYVADMGYVFPMYFQCTPCHLSLCTNTPTPTHPHTLFQPPSCRWVAYIVGALVVLQRECHVDVQSHGMSLLISSAVPEGKGVSSSAAVEVASMAAVAAAYGVQLEGRAMALLCQKVCGV